MTRARRVLAFCWPFLASLAAMVIVIAGVVSIASTLSQRNELRAQSERVEQLVIANREVTEQRAERLAEGVRLVADELDRVTTLRHEQLVARIEELLARPAGVPQEPVTAVPPE